MTYKDFPSWKKALELTKRIYEISSCWPDQEKFGLVDQIRRAVVSICSNIAEGYGRYDDGDKKRFLSIARGSAYEVEAQLLVAKELGYADDIEEVTLLVQEVCALLNAARRCLQ